MRVAIVFDMEGTSHIGDLREPYPPYREYWRAGRQKLAKDLAAAAQGLIDGGATRLMLVNHHGGSDVEWPNALLDALPPGIELADGWHKREIRDRADAMFQVGAHARGGSPSFLSHTIVPGMRLRLAGELLSESHWWAWTGDVPVLGIVGSAELGADLGAPGGTLSEVPFLAVQRSTDRTSARPVFDSPAATAGAIRAFARSAIADAAHRPSVTPTGPIRLESSIQNGVTAAPQLAAKGWRQTSDTEFVIESTSWREPDERIDEAIHGLVDAAIGVYGAWFAGLDPTSEETSLALPSRDLFDREFRIWAAEATPDWFTPEIAAARWEGREPGP
jgi:D-aminopeptidase